MAYCYREQQKEPRRRRLESATKPGLGGTENLLVNKVVAANYSDIGGRFALLRMKVILPTRFTDRFCMTHHVAVSVSGVSLAREALGAVMVPHNACALFT